MYTHTSSGSDDGSSKDGAVFWNKQRREKSKKRMGERVGGKILSSCARGHICYVFAGTEARRRDAGVPHRDKQGRTRLTETVKHSRFMEAEAFGWTRTHVAALEFGDNNSVRGFESRKHKKSGSVCLSDTK